MPIQRLWPKPGYVFAEDGGIIECVHPVSSRQAVGTPEDGGTTFVVCVRCGFMDWPCHEMNLSGREREAYLLQGAS
jgi:hypothetical protein